MQSASITFSQGPEVYGDSYYLVIRCEAGSALRNEEHQRFAAVVELTRQANVQLY